MKVILLVVFALAATTYASKTQDQIVALLQTGTKASDAIDTVFQVLNDLKQSNIDAQFAADKKNETDEWLGEQTIESFTKIKSLNQKLFNAAIANREHYEQVLQETKNYLAWNEARRDEIARKIESLEENQCYSNQLFVRSIKQNQEALEVVRTLKQDVAGYVINGDSFEFAQSNKAQSVSEKLRQYSSLFQENQIKSFLALANKQDEEGEEVEHRSENTLAERVLHVLEDLEAALDSSLENLKVNEINASWELAGWVALSEAEITTLEVEHERKSVFADRTATQIQASFAQQAKAKIILQDSQDSLDQATADLENKRDAWAADKAKRDEENAILDEVIIMFKKQVSSWSGR